MIEYVVDYVEAKRYDTIRYEIYLLQLAFHPVTVVLTLVHKKQRTIRNQSWIKNVYE